MFENVPAITTKTVEKHSKELIVDLLKKELAEAGYSNHHEVILSADQFGVPQRRKRFFILASRFPDWKLLEPSPTCSREVTVADAFAGLPNVIPNSEIEGTAYTGEESDFSSRMKDDAFWNRPAGTGTITYHNP